MIKWVIENTEYDAFKGEDFKSKNGGAVTDWCFKEFHIPSFALEILTPDYGRYTGEDKHDNLVHWMKSALPFFMYLIVNIENLNSWQIPDIQPPLPDGIPPDPLK